MKKHCKCKIPDYSLPNYICNKCHKKVKFIKTRKTWGRNPETQIKRSKKLYNRTKIKDLLRKKLEG